PALHPLPDPHTSTYACLASAAWAMPIAHQGRLSAVRPELPDLRPDGAPVCRCARGLTGRQVLAMSCCFMVGPDGPRTAPHPTPPNLSRAPGFRLSRPRGSSKILSVK